jgi:hypothetical protein
MQQVIENIVCIVLLHGHIYATDKDRKAIAFSNNTHTDDGYMIPATTLFLLALGWLARPYYFTPCD